MRKTANRFGNFISFHKKSLLDADELSPAAELEFEIQVTASGRKFFNVRLKACAAFNLPIEAAKVFRPYVCFVAYGAGVKERLVLFLHDPLKF